MDLNERYKQPLYKIIEESFANHIDEIRGSSKNEETFKVNFLNCELSNNMPCVNFVFSVNGIRKIICIGFDEIVGETFEYICYKILTTLLVIGGGK